MSSPCDDGVDRCNVLPCTPCRCLLARALERTTARSAQVGAAGRRIPRAGAGGRDTYGIPPHRTPELWLMLLYPNHQLTLPRLCSPWHCSVRPLSRGPASQCPCSAAKPMPCTTASPPTYVRSRAPRAAVVSAESHRMLSLSGIELRPSQMEMRMPSERSTHKQNLPASV